MENKDKIDINEEDSEDDSDDEELDEDIEEYDNLDDIVINSRPSFRNRVSLGMRQVIQNPDSIQNLELDLSTIPTTNSNNENNTQYSIKDDYANSSKPDAYQESKYDSGTYPKTISAPSFNPSTPSLSIGNNTQSNIFRQNNDPTVNSSYPETIDRTQSYDPINEKPKRNIW